MSLCLVQSEAITTGVIATDMPKEKSAAGADKASYFFSSPTLSPETELVPLWMSDEEDETKENLPNPLDLGGANNAAPEDKPLLSFLLFYPLVFIGMGKSGGASSNTNPLLVISLEPDSVPL